MIRAVDKYSSLLRAVVATASNDHRLGANEAPPAIISIFLGDQLNDVFEQIKSGPPKTSKKGGTMNVGVDTLPPFPMDAGDRNRTSPFAFTGNRFEYRAVGSSQTIGGPLVALNTIVAESLDYIATELEKATGGDLSKLGPAVQVVLQQIITQHGRVIFNGDGYSEEWHQEAAKRGLPNYKTSINALPTILNPEVIEVFSKYGVLTPREVQSRHDIYFEQYVKVVLTEAKLVIEMGKTMIYPAASRYQGQLASTAASIKAAGLTPCTKALEEVIKLTTGLCESIATLERNSPITVMAWWTKPSIAAAKFCQPCLLCADSSINSKRLCPTISGHFPRIRKCCLLNKSKTARYARSATIKRSQLSESDFHRRIDGVRV